MLGEVLLISHLFPKRDSFEERGALLLVSFKPLYCVIPVMVGRELHGESEAFPRMETL